MTSRQSLPTLRLVLAIVLAAPGLIQAQPAAVTSPSTQPARAQALPATSRAPSRVPDRSGAEVSMTELQDLQSKRQTQLQLTTGMLEAQREGTKVVAGNIVDGGPAPQPPCTPCVRARKGK
jgi:hypothetical protein